MVVMLDGSVTETKDEHPTKKLLPMVVMLDGSVMDDKDEYSSKTSS